MSRQLVVISLPDYLNPMKLEAPDFKVRWTLDPTHEFIPLYAFAWHKEWDIKPQFSIWMHDHLMGKFGMIPRDCSLAKKAWPFNMIMAIEKEEDMVLIKLTWPSE